MTTNLAANAYRAARKSWEGNIDGLAQELFSILASDSEPATGPIAVAVAASGTPNVFYEAPSQSGLNIPVIDLDAPTPEAVVGTTGVEGEDASEQGVSDRKITRTTSWWQRSVLIGQIVSYDGGSSTYTVNVYPNGTNNDPVQLTGVVPKFPTGTGDQVPASRWVYVFRAQNAVNQEREFKNDTGERISLSQKLSVDSHRAEFINQDFLHDDVTIPLGGNLTLQTTSKLYFRDSAIYIYSSSDGNLDVNADDGVNITISGTNQVRVTNDNMTLLTGGTNVILNFATSNLLYLSQGNFLIANNFEVDGTARFDNTVQINATLDLNGVLDVSSTSTLTGKVTCGGEIEIDGTLNHDGSAVGFFGKAPSGQASDIGTVSLGSVAGVGNVDPTAVGNNFSTCQTQLNAIRDVLRYHGLMA